MATVTARKLGGISYRTDRAAFEVTLRERPGVRGKSTYVKAPDNEAGRRLAERELARRIDALGRGERHIGRRLTVDAWLDEWLALQVAVKPSTRRAYEARIRLYLRPAFAGYRLAELGPIDVTREFARLAMKAGERTPNGISVGTLDAAFRVLNAALADAADLGKAPRNACRGAKVPRPSVHVEPPTQAELDQLFAAIGEHRWRAVFSVMRWTGARHGEVLGLTWRNVDLEAGIVRLVKQASGSLKTRRSVRAVLLPPAVVDELRAIPHRVVDGKRVELVFSTASGKPLNERNVLRVFDGALEATKLRPAADADLDKYRPHDLRHAFATLLLEAGVGSAIVAGALGHASLSMLDRYSHVRTIPGGDSYRRMLEAFGADVRLFGLRPADPRHEALEL